MCFGVGCDCVFIVYLLIIDFASLWCVYVCYGLVARLVWIVVFVLFGHCLTRLLCFTYMVGLVDSCWFDY